MRTTCTPPPPPNPTLRTQETPDKRFQMFCKVEHGSWQQACFNTWCHRDLALDTSSCHGHGAGAKYWIFALCANRVWQQSWQRTAAVSRRSTRLRISLSTRIIDIQMRSRKEEKKSTTCETLCLIALSTFKVLLGLTINCQINFFTVNLHTTTVRSYNF